MKCRHIPNLTVHLNVVIHQSFQFKLNCYNICACISGSLRIFYKLKITLDSALLLSYLQDFVFIFLAIYVFCNKLHGTSIFSWNIPFIFFIVIETEICCEFDMRFDRQRASFIDPSIWMSAYLLKLNYFLTCQDPTLNIHLFMFMIYSCQNIKLTLIYTQLPIVFFILFFGQELHIVFCILFIYFLNNLYFIYSKWPI